MDRPPVPARSGSRRNADSLRSLPSAPGLAAWGGLPERDRAVLRWLLVGNTLTAELAALLAYGSLRTARRRLARLVELGLVRGFWAANSQRPRGRYAYELTRPVRGELVRTAEPVRRPIRPERPARGTIHELATNDLLAAFLRAADPERGLGLVAWLPERAVAPLFDGYVRPDALAVIGTPSSRIPLLLERDLGTEGSRVVAAKVERYAMLLGGPSAPVNVGIVVESARRVASIGRAIDAAGSAPASLWLATSATLLAAPYDGMWSTPGGDRRRTVDLPGEPSRASAAAGALCLLDPDAAERFELGALEDVPGLRRYVDRR